MCGSHLCGWACGNCGAAELGEVFACTAEPARAAACERGVGCEFHSMCWLCLACTCSRETTAACLGCVGGRESRAVCLLLTSRDDRYFSFIRIFFFQKPFMFLTSKPHLLFTCSCLLSLSSKYFSTTPGKADLLPLTNYYYYYAAR